MDGETSSQDKVWNFQDLRNLSLDWNLKGDRILLQILENVHKDVLSKANQTREKLDVLSSDLSGASISLMNVNNKFISLGNTQFIENKVQEDDVVDANEAKESNNTDIIVNKSEVDARKTKASEDLQVDILNTVSKSLDVLEGLCEKIHITSDTDSESDDSESNLVSNVILRPQDIYADKPLPYIIGTQKWLKKWHIGLEECSSDESDSENEKSTKKEDDEEYSSSDESVESSLPKDSKVDLSNKKNQMTLPIQKRHSMENPSSVTSTSTNNSTDMADSEVAKINDVQRDLIKNTQSAAVHDDDDIFSTHNKPAPQTLVKASDFAAELAKKLGGNLNDQAPIASSKTVDNKKDKVAPISTLPKESTARVTGNIFSDEPPPLESQPKDKQRNNFFSDDENNEDDVSAGLFGDEPSPNFHSTSRNDLFSAPGVFKNKQTSNYGGLFDDLPSDDGGDAVKKPIKKTVKLEKKVTSLFDDDSDDDDLFNTKSSIRSNPNAEKPTADSSKKPPKLEKKTSVVTKPQVKSLFDDFANSDEDDLLFGSSNMPSKTETANKNVKSSVLDNSKLSLSKSLFDDVSDSDDDLFASNKISKIQSTSNLKPKQNTIVEAKPIIEESIKVERESPKISKSTPQSPPTIDTKPLVKEIKSEIQKDTPNITTKPPIKNDAKIETPKEIPNESKNVNKQSTDRIDEVKENSTESETKRESTVIVNSGVNITSGLFDDVPPPLDDDISDAKESKKVFDDYDDDDLFGSGMNFNKSGSINRSDALFPSNDDDFLHTNRTINLFSDEPPDYTESKNDDPPSTESENKPAVSDLDSDSKKSKAHTDLFDTTIKKMSKDEKDNSKTFNSNVKSKPPPKPTIEKVSLFSDSEDDLFTTNKIDSSKKVEPSELFTDSDTDNLFSSVSKTQVSNVIKTDIPDLLKVAKLPPQTKEHNANISKNDNAVSDDNLSPVKKTSNLITSSPDKLISKSVISSAKNVAKMERSNSDNMLPVKSINKLQNNVIINVKALMPSSIPKSVKEIKNITEENVSSEVSDKSNVGLNNEPKSLDSTLCNDILKERVKIKVKRRPSSRRARHEAVRKSAADIYNFTDDIEQPDNGNECTLSLPNSPEKKVKSDITISKMSNTNKNTESFKDDITKKLSNTSNVLGNKATLEKIEHVIGDKKSQEERDVQSMPNLFGDLLSKNKAAELSDDDLFSAKNAIKPLSKGPSEKATTPIVKTNTRGLFSDSDSESDLFAPKVNKNENKTPSKVLPTNVNKPTATGKSTANTSIFDDVEGDDLFFVPNKSSQSKKTILSDKSIFGDDDSDDEFDIFKTQKSTQQEKSQSKIANVKTVDRLSSSKPSGTSKPQKTEEKVSSSFQDPLSKFLDD
ncbi:uncharacterized protein LOC143915197 [Arctopsyche grandis]|uniref:uncharacterized protein LOC143915197 n=1 Tax=Arctopsyche grandis TaxID=121162 RepID=UPI00406D79EF